MRFLTFLTIYFLIILACAALLCWITREPPDNARCSLQNKGLTIICNMDGRTILGSVEK